MQMSSFVKHGADTGAGALIVGAMMQYLPPLAALLGVIWYAVQIWESKTVQKRVRVWKQRKRISRLAVLQSKVSDVEARIEDGSST